MKNLFVSVDNFSDRAIKTTNPYTQQSVKVSRGGGGPTEDCNQGFSILC